MQRPHLKKSSDFPVLINFSFVKTLKSVEPLTSCSPGIINKPSNTPLTMAKILLLLDPKIYQYPQSNRMVNETLSSCQWEVCTVKPRYSANLGELSKLVLS